MNIKANPPTETPSFFADRHSSSDLCFAKGRRAGGLSAERYQSRARGRPHADQAIWFEFQRTSLRYACGWMRANGVTERNIGAWQSGYQEIIAKAVMTDLDLRAGLFEGFPKAAH